MRNDTPLYLRVPREFKKRLEEAAKSRGLSVAAYMRDRLEDCIREDLSKLRELRKEEAEDEQYNIAA